jgi:hypothetical protein
VKIVYSLQDVKDLLRLAADEDHHLIFEKVEMSGYGENIEFTLSVLENHKEDEDGSAPD